MCGRYASFLPAEALARVFGTTGPLPNLEPTWNMAPTKDAPIVRFDPHTGERRLEVAKWGLVPFFTKGLAKARKPINARCETVARRDKGRLHAEPSIEQGVGRHEGQERRKLRHAAAHRSTWHRGGRTALRRERPMVGHRLPKRPSPALTQFGLFCLNERM